MPLVGAVSESGVGDGPVRNDARAPLRESLFATERVPRKVGGDGLVLPLVVLGHDAGIVVGGAVEDPELAGVHAERAGLLLPVGLGLGARVDGPQLGIAVVAVPGVDADHGGLPRPPPRRPREAVESRLLGGIARIAR